jgi:hypothetical protein
MARSPAGRLITVAQTKRLGSKACRRAVAVAVAAVIGVHEDVGAALQFGIDAARRLVSFQNESGTPGRMKLERSRSK